DLGQQAQTQYLIDERYYQGGKPITHHDNDDALVYGYLRVAAEIVFGSEPRHCRRNNGQDGKRTQATAAIGSDIDSCFFWKSRRVSRLDERYDDDIGNIG